MGVRVVSFSGDHKLDTRPSVAALHSLGMEASEDQIESSFKADSGSAHHWISPLTESDSYLLQAEVIRVGPDVRVLSLWRRGGGSESQAHGHR
jgi:hypothetical protein